MTGAPTSPSRGAGMLVRSVLPAGVAAATLASPAHAQPPGQPSGEAPAQPSGQIQAAPSGKERGCAPAPAVPGAEKQVSACLDDLTTAGTIASGHTVPADWAGLHATGTRNPSGVPGVQVDGISPTPPRSTPTTAGTTTPSSSSVSRRNGTAASSSPVRPATGASTPTTSRFPTGSSPGATPTPRPTRATAARSSTRTAAGPATPSSNGTAG